MFESKSGILLIAGLGFFALAFVSQAVVPMVMYADKKTKIGVEEEAREVPLKGRTVEEMLNQITLASFADLQVRYPDQFKKYYGEASPEKCAEALRVGRDAYIGEACWHCHSQFVRPVSNEEKRWGRVSFSAEYANELQRPVLFGTRRVGPDLIRESRRRGNDWQAVHLFKPRLTSPESVMPEYPWFFDADETGQPNPGLPNKRGLGLITYMQWLGSWVLDEERYHAVERRAQ